VCFINIFYIVMTQFIIFDKDFSDRGTGSLETYQTGAIYSYFFRKFDVATIKLIALLLFAFILTAL